MVSAEYSGAAPQVFADLVETPETTAPLLTADGVPVSGKAGVRSCSQVQTLQIQIHIDS